MLQNQRALAVSTGCHSVRLAEWSHARSSSQASRPTLVLVPVYGWSTSPSERLDKWAKRLRTYHYPLWLWWWQMRLLGYGLWQESICYHTFIRHYWPRLKSYPVIDQLFFFQVACKCTDCFLPCNVSNMMTVIWPLSSLHVVMAQWLLIKSWS